MSARLTTSRRAFLLAAGLSTAMLSKGSAAEGEPGAPPTLIKRAYDPTAPFDMDDPAAIQDIEWRVTEMVDATIPEDTFISLTFGKDGAFYGGACNRFRGSYRVQRSSLSFGSVAGTLMACPEPQMTLERTLFETLGRVKGYSLARAGSLRLIDAGDAALIVAWP